MKISYETKSKMKITLDGDDLSALGITAEQLGRECDTDRTVIDEILLLSGAVKNRRECRGLLLDAMQAFDDACILWVCRVPEQERRLCYRLDGADAVLMLRELLPDLNASLYRYQNEFYLDVRCPGERQRIVLSEYAHLCKTKSALLQEHAELIGCWS